MVGFPLVCSKTPSQASIMRMTMSVMFAPRERIPVNAACPGVSMKVSAFPLSKQKQRDKEGQISP